MRVHRKIVSFAVSGIIAAGAAVLIYTQLWSQVDEASTDASKATAHRVQETGIEERKGLSLTHLEVGAELKDDKSGQPDESRAGRKPKVSESELVAQAYHPASAEELSDIVWQLGLTHPDAFAAMDSADTLCSVYASPSRIQEFRQQSVPGIESSEESLNFLSDYSNEFCDGYSAETFSQETKSYSMWLQEAVESAREPEARRLFETALKELEGRLDDPDAKIRIRSDLEDIVASTESPYVFKEAASRLVSGRYGEWGVGPDLDERPMDGSSPYEVRQAGLMIAYCRVSNACGPDSAQSIQTCAPYHCRPGITVQDVYRDMYSPYAMRMAEEVAEDILEYRR